MKLILIRIYQISDIRNVDSKNSKRIFYIYIYIKILVLFLLYLARKAWIVTIMKIRHILH